MTLQPPPPIFGNAAEASQHNRGWFLGYFMTGPFQTGEVEVKWFHHERGAVRPEWAPASPVRTLDVLIRGHFVLVFPDRELSLEKEGDFALYGPGMPHSYRCPEASLVLTVRWPSVAAPTAGTE